MKAQSVVGRARRLTPHRAKKFSIALANGDPHEAGVIAPDAHDLAGKGDKNCNILHCRRLALLDGVETVNGKQDSETLLAPGGGWRRDDDGRAFGARRPSA